MQHLIELSCQIYFWLFCFVLFLHIGTITFKTDEYYMKKESDKNAVKNGIYDHRMGVITFIAWFLFILSLLYK